MAAGSRVLTAGGLVPIEHVRVGMPAATPLVASGAGYAGQRGASGATYPIWCSL